MKCGWGYGGVVALFSLVGYEVAHGWGESGVLETQIGRPSSVAASVVGWCFAGCCLRAPVSAVDCPRARFQGPEANCRTDAKTVPQDAVGAKSVGR